MLSWLANAWRVPELRKRVLFTALVLAVYRLGSWLPAGPPGAPRPPQMACGAGCGVSAVPTRRRKAPRNADDWRKGTGFEKCEEYG